MPPGLHLPSGSWQSQPVLQHQLQYWHAHMRVPWRGGMSPRAHNFSRYFAGAPDSHLSISIGFQRKAAACSLVPQGCEIAKDLFQHACRSASGAQSYILPPPTACHHHTRRRIAQVSLRQPPHELGICSSVLTVAPGTHPSWYHYGRCSQWMLSFHPSDAAVSPIRMMTTAWTVEHHSQHQVLCIATVGCAKCCALNFSWQLVAHLTSIAGRHSSSSATRTTVSPIVFER